MKHCCFLLLLITLSVCSTAQPNSKVDSVVQLIRQYFNEKSAEKLYSLTGQDFQKALSAEDFKIIGQNSLFTLGEMPAPVFTGMSKGQSAYKIDFALGVIGMYVSLDSKGKLSGFTFEPYVNETPSTQKLNTPSAFKRYVDVSVKNYVDAKATAGLSVGIIKNNQITYYHYGKSRLVKGLRPNNSTFYEIGSITKTFTTLLFALAIDEGKVGPEEPLSKYLPSLQQLQFEGTPITLKMLANHTSGLPEMSDNFDTLNTDVEDPFKLYGEKELLAFYKDFILTKKPGTSYGYSNLGMAMLGWVLEKVYQKSFEQLVAEKITRPLGMSNTKQHLSGVDMKHFPPGYDEEGKLAKHFSFQVYAPAGALHSTLVDMMQYAKACMTTNKPALQKAMALTQMPTFDDGNNKLGLGWHFIEPGKTEWLFHNGGTYGFSSYLAFNKKNRTAVVVLSNCGRTVDEIGNKIMLALEVE